MIELVGVLLVEDLPSSFQVVVVVTVQVEALEASSFPDDVVASLPASSSSFLDEVVASSCPDEDEVDASFVDASYLVVA